MRIISIAGGLMLLLAQQAASQPPPIRVLASNGVKAVLEELQPQCERARGHPLAIEFNSTAALRPRIDAGEAFDVVILTSEAIDDLVRVGKIAAGARVDLARCGIGVGIRTGAQRPDIRTAEALRQTLLRVKSITYAQDGASRTHLEKIFSSLGIANDLKPKIVMQQGSTRSTAMVADGKVEIVMTLISEIVPVHGIELAGPLPAALQSYVRFAAGAGANAEHAGPARALIQFLAGPAAAPAYKAKGMEPAR
jgi:molybdate transport system substrate-binding protein